MTVTRRFMWAGAALASFLWPLLLAAGIARANGIGDLYVGAGDKVVEVHLAGKATVNAVDLPAGATSVAFSPDGATLYIATGAAQVQVIDIGTISLVSPISASGPTVAVAHPAGSRLALAIPDKARVALVDPADGTSNDVPVSGPVDLLAADRRETVFLAAATTGGWVAVIDAALGTSHTIAVDGRVVGLAVDRDTGAAYVATRSPDAVLRVELGTAKIDWTVKVDGSPTAVAAVADRAVVATGMRLLGVTSKGARTFATLPGDAVALAGTDDGKVLVAAMAGRVQGFAATGGTALSEVTLDKGLTAKAIAPVPKPIVLDGAAGTAKPVPTPKPPLSGVKQGAPGGAASPGTTKGSAKGPRASHPPATSTEVVPGRPEGSASVLGAAGVAVAILAAWWGAQLVQEYRHRRALVRARATGRPRRRRHRPQPPRT